MSFIKSSLILVGLVVAALAGGIYFGAVHPGADEPHSAVVSKLIESARDRAVAVRARDIIVPALGDETQVLSGAGNYAAMCTDCHLAPGMGPTELSSGLYPAPPALTLVGVRDPARAFWVIKHGIKASGMPAWGSSMPDEYIWNMVAFLQKMPELTPAQYQALVASSDGHHHGGGEAMPHHDGMPSENSDHHGSAETGAHDDTGSAPHAHDPAPPQPPAHDDAGAPPHDH